jgi:hypothetical protein
MDKNCKTCRSACKCKKYNSYKKFSNIKKPSTQDSLHPKPQNKKITFNKTVN